MSTLQTIIPIFAIIFLGVLARQRGFITPPFLEPANRLVYYLAIPAMIFRAIGSSSLSSELNPRVVSATLLCIPIQVVFAWFLSRMRGNGGGRSGTFMQCTFHGNLGYIGLAVTFYYLGQAGLVKASIIAGLIMIVQNFAGVLVLQLAVDQQPKGGRVKQFVERILINPVIISALLGIGYASLKLPIPIILDRSLKILSGLALPTALLLIGASLSFSLVKTQLSNALTASLAKLILLPAIGLSAYHFLGLSSQDYLPGLILLAAPPATLTYVFARQMQGDAELAVACVSVGTILSGFTYAAWLHWVG